MVTIEYFYFSFNLTFVLCNECIQYKFVIMNDEAVNIHYTHITTISITMMMVVVIKRNDIFFFLFNLWCICVFYIRVEIHFKKIIIKTITQPFIKMQMFQVFNAIYTYILIAINVFIHFFVSFASVHFMKQKKVEFPDGFEFIRVLEMLSIMIHDNMIFRSVNII